MCDKCKILENKLTTVNKRCEELVNVLAEKEVENLKETIATLRSLILRHLQTCQATLYK